MQNASGMQQLILALQALNSPGQALHDNYYGRNIWPKTLTDTVTAGIVTI